MTQTYLEPELSACIQTQAKREYDRIVKELLATGVSNKELEQEVELLRVFLENTDFNKLRSEYEPYLVEGKRVRFLLRYISDNPDYSYDVI